MRDARISELISAFLDGELTVEERALLEQELATSAESRLYLEQLKRQRMALQGIPRQKLSSSAAARIQAAIQAAQPSASPPAPGPSDSIWELISAHLDGELTVAERASVERHLADSGECREYLEQLRQQRGLLASIPRHKLPAAVSKQIMAAIKAARSSVAKEEPILATLATSEKPRTRSRWRTALLVAGPMIAAGLLVALIVVRNWETKVKSGPGTTIAGNEGKKVEETIPGVPEVVPVKPEDMALAVKEFRKQVKMLMVYDVYVTPKGRQSKCVDKWFTAAGIPVADKIKIDAATEKAIFNSPFIVANPAVQLPGKVDDQDVEMLLVRGLGKHINAIQRAYHKNQSLELGEAQLLTDLILDTPRELEILLRLNEATGMGLAQMKADPGILRLPRAFPVAFAAHARSSFLGGFGLTSMVVGSSEETPAKSTPDNKTEKKSAELPANSELAPQPPGSVGWDDPSQCLIIIRTIK